MIISVPLLVENVHVTSVKSTEISLTWNPPPSSLNVASYEVGFSDEVLEPI